MAAGADDEVGASEGPKAGAWVRDGSAAAKVGAGVGSVEDCGDGVTRGSAPSEGAAARSSVFDAAASD